MINRNSPTNTYQIGKKEIKVIELKYNGEKYENIAKAVGVALPTIKDWFSTGGKLREYYLDYEAEQSELFKNEAQKVVTKNVLNAAETLVNLLTSKTDQVRLKAAESILEKELGKTTIQPEERKTVNIPLMVADELRRMPEPQRERAIEMLKKRSLMMRRIPREDFLNPIP